MTLTIVVSIAGAVQLTRLLFALVEKIEGRDGDAKNCRTTQ